MREPYPKPLQRLKTLQAVEKEPATDQTTARVENRLQGLKPLQGLQTACRV
ncbi:MAG: hypothetical protein LBD53_08580 [Tannerella sp.]|nr:hypothetical protein [Tannerella sp.]